MLKKYKIIGVLWNDHTVFRNTSLPKDVVKMIIPSLTVGILWKEEDGILVILSHLDSYGDDEPIADYSLIYKDSVINLQEYGEIELAI